jgi:hypothetical protein
MPTMSEKAQREKVYLRLFNESFSRMRKRGLSEHEAGQIAKEVAERSLKRIETPVYDNQQQFSRVVGRVCRRLSDGASYYALIGEMPYLATARIDRVVAVAVHTDPPVEHDVAAAARRSTRVERLSASLALLFMGLALGTLGLWWAIGIGAVLAVAGEVYVELLMPPAARRTIADARLPLVANVAAASVLVYFGYRWLVDEEPQPLFVFFAVVALVVVTWLLPAITISRLVSGRERRHRKALERKLLDKDE